MPPYVSPGAMAVDAMQQYLMQRAAMENQAQQKQLNALNIQSLIEQRQQAAEDRKQALADKAEAAKTVTAESLGLPIGTPLGMQGQPMTIAQKKLPELMQKTVPGPIIPAGANTVQLPGTQETPEGQPVETPQPTTVGGAQPALQTPGTVEWAGTGKQKALEQKKAAGANVAAALWSNDSAKAQALAGILEANPEMPLGDAVKIVHETNAPTAATEQPVMRVNPRTGKMEQIGTAPKGAHFVTQPAPTNIIMPTTHLTDEELLGDALQYRTNHQLPAGIYRNQEESARIRKLANDPQLDAKIAARNTANVAAGGGEVPNYAANAAQLDTKKAALKQVEGNVNAVESYAKTAKVNTGIFDKIAKDVPDLGMAWVNKPWRDLATAMGGERGETMARFKAIKQSLTAEYGRLVNNPNLTGVLPVTVLMEMKDAIADDATVGMMKAALEVLTQEGQNRHQSLIEQRDQLNAEIRGIGSAKKPAEGSGAKVRKYNPATGGLE